MQDELVAIEVADLLLAMVALSGLEGLPFWLAVRWFPYRAHFGYTKVVQVAESVEAGYG